MSQSDPRNKPIIGMKEAMEQSMIGDSMAASAIRVLAEQNNILSNNPTINVTPPITANRVHPHDVAHAIAISIGVLAKLPNDAICDIIIMEVDKPASFSKETVYLYRGKDGFQVIGSYTVSNDSRAWVDLDAIGTMAAQLSLLKDNDKT